MPYPSTAQPGLLLPGAAVPGQLSGGNPSIALFTAPRMSAAATAGPDLNLLWTDYQRARLFADSQWVNWRMMRQAGGTDGTAGFLYGKAYEAERLADAAYETFQATQRRVYPGVTG